LKSEELIRETWLKQNIISDESFTTTISSDHYYYNAPHTMKINLKDTERTKLSIIDNSLMDAGDSLYISTDQEATKTLVKISGNISKRDLNYESGSFFIHYPLKGSNLFAFGLNSH
jgi:hypothetical protein